ncbi:hypothetical protein FSARC_12560 [Fusarium sarcochroum]|uniref:Uncharacterized protein n=1 Tax=Fusarium sarcochroum TaxID=1208366 RepID=A0A8H4WVY9_9HYPO|nr:hypothetical protein FSARC_12560 [Fusarium sarcochroum]
MPGIDCLARLVDDPVALRSAILLAGMHFSFQFGGLASFEPTFLFHKVEIINLINQWIASRDRRLESAIIRQIATLAFTEICHGELVAAETHMSGIMAMVETSHDGQKHPSIPNCGRSIDQELTNRYFVLSYGFLCGLKSLLSGISQAGGYADNIKLLSGKKLVELSHQWHTSEALQSLAFKLKALRLCPFFFSPLPPGAQLKSADGNFIMKILRELTLGIDQAFVGRFAEPSDARFDSFWRQGPASRLLEEFVIAHVQSISVNGNNAGDSQAQQSSFTGPWCGIVIASVFYMEHILGVLGAVDKSIHKYAITLFQQDVAMSLADESGPRNNEFLLWQLLLGLISSRVYQRDKDTRGLSSITRFLQKALRQQAQTLGVASWSEAKAMLLKVVWPVRCAEDGFMRDLWNDAVL